MKRLVLPVTVAVLALVLLRFAREYPWPLALIAALAIGALAHVARRTVEQLRRTTRGRSAE